MSEKKIEISKIVVKVGGNDFELSLKEALELKKILNDTFPDKEFVYIPSSPVIIDRYPQPYRPYDVWSKTTSDNTLCLSTTPE